MHDDHLMLSFLALHWVVPAPREAVRLLRATCGSRLSAPTLCSLSCCATLCESSSPNPLTASCVRRRMVRKGGAKAKP